MSESPKKAVSKRGQFEAAKAAENLKALERDFNPTPSNEWIRTKAWWTTATDEQKRDMVYGLTAYSAAKPKQIARYFSIQEIDLKPFQEQLSMGAAARILKINEHQLRWALTTSQPHAKFFLGLQFAGQVQNPVHEDTSEIGSEGPKSLFEDLTVVETHRDQTGRTVAPPTVIPLARDKRDQKVG